MFAGIALLLTGIWGLWRDVPVLATSFYVFAWWGVIFIADGYCVLRRGSSLMTTRRRHLPYIIITSVTFWMFFEFLNMRFQNWYYIGVIPYKDIWSLLYGGGFAVLAFSTVFMGMFEIHDAVCATGMFRNWRGQRRPLGRGVVLSVQLLGVAMASLAILRPYYLAPLIWGSLSFLVDPVNYRKGARSILRDIENGEWGVVARLLLAGLISGIIWESANFYAPQKWVYTVRGLENFKLFEMPLLGFMGFPGLMLDVVAAYSLFCWLFLGNASWEHPEDVLHPLPACRSLPQWVFAASIAPQVFFWGWMGLFCAPIGSLQLELDDLPLLSEKAAQELRMAGIPGPKRLLLEAAKPDTREQVRRRISYEPQKFADLLDQADLYTFKGIGSWFGPLLNEAGIYRVEQLASQDEEELFSRLCAIADREGTHFPSRDMIRVWILGARSRSILQRPGTSLQ